MLEANPLGSLVAILAASAWGAGDFMGGLAARKNSPYQVVVLVSISGLLILAGAMLLRGEGFPTPQDTLWAITASISGTIGIAALYQGLASAQAALVAPTASVVGVALPVILSTILSGPPSAEKWAGIATGALGIWLVSSSSHRAGGDNRGALLLALLAGLGFGGFFILIAQVDTRQHLLPPGDLQAHLPGLCPDHPQAPTRQAALPAGQLAGFKRRFLRCLPAMYSTC